MSMQSAQSKLRQAARDLKIYWDQANDQWRDQVSEDFFNRYLAGVDPKIRAAVAAMDQMSEKLAAARRECS